MRQNNLISVIVPVYKVEKYLHACVDSLLRQTYRNLEIILVNDGSPDNCPQICDEYAKADKRIKVIHKQNGGVGEARNAGMQLAKGEYWGFVDSDDSVDEDYFEILMHAMLQYDADLVSCDSRVNELDSQKRSKLSHVLTRQEAFKKRYLCHGYFYNSICNKLCKKEVFSGVKFPDYKFAEDLSVSIKVMLNSSKLAYIDYAGYFYRQRNDSAMSNYGIQAYLNLYWVLETNEYPLLKEFPDIRNIIADVLIRQYIKICTCIISYDEQNHYCKIRNSSEKRIEELLQYLSGVNKVIAKFYLSYPRVFANVLKVLRE